MSALIAVGPCYTCGRATQFNPEAAPSVYVCLGCKRPADMHAEDCAKTAEVARLPLCADCVKLANELRKRDGILPIEILPGAYGAQIIE